MDSLAIFWLGWTAGCLFLTFGLLLIDVFRRLRS